MIDATISRVRMCDLTRLGRPAPESGQLAPRTCDLTASLISYGAERARWLSRGGRLPPPLARSGRA
jgi:hypothetical protein